MTDSKTFERIDYTVNLLARDEYENCIFKNCNFHKSDLSNIVFRECTFDGCDFSLASLKHTTLNDIRFVNCKLLGVQFHECNSFLLSVSFENCVLKLSVFYRLKLKKTKFIQCNMQETDFTESDLTGSFFDDCDLSRAVFYNTNLEKANFSSAFNYTFDPELNRIKKARFSRLGVIGLLEKYNIEIE